MHFENSNALRKRAQQLIPGGAHTYAKGDDQYPELSPGFIARGLGCHVFDVDGNEFIEYGMGLRSVTLGHAFPPVVEAASRQMLLGQNFNRPTPIEAECAEAMLKLLPGMDMIKFAKNGSDATTAAIKLARACTGRDMVAICADHPFFSVDDWFIGVTPMHAGIPQNVKNQTLKFKYNSLESVEALFAEYPEQIACCILEPATSADPENQFLHRLAELCRRNGTLIIFDETITGFRWHIGGAQTYYDIVPDLSTFGKAMGNGFSVAALAGKREFMELGGIHHNRKRVFLLSTTHGAETHSLAAALKTIEIYEKEGVVEVLKKQGTRLRQGIDQIISSVGIGTHFKVMGFPMNLFHASFDQEGKPSQAFRTLFLQELIRRGVLAPSFVVSFSHGDADIDKTIEAVEGALRVYRNALDQGVEKFLVGKPSKPVWREFN